MATYRIYLVSLRGRVRQGPSFEADDDETALGRLQLSERLDVETAELWRGGHLLQRLPPRDYGAPAPFRRSPVRRLDTGVIMTAHHDEPGRKPSSAPIEREGGGQANADRAAEAAPGDRRPGEDLAVRQEELVDEAIQETFPASDPIAPKRIV